MLMGRPSRSPSFWLSLVIQSEYKTKGRPPKPTLRRTLSLDTLVGPYLQGNWPRDPECQPVTCVNDKATQTPSSWIEETRGRRGVGGHKRSASWGSAEHLREATRRKQNKQTDSHKHIYIYISDSRVCVCVQTMPLIPLSRLAPRLRRSVEGLNLELEGVFVSETAKEQHKILDVPDGHRAPVPAQRYSSASQSDPSPAQLSPSHSPSHTELALRYIIHILATHERKVCVETVNCPPSSSPRPNKTYVFQREPPEGCERVRVSEEAILPCDGNAPLQPSCPDPNKVNFTPHGGSAFCPVSLLKPLLPSMDLLFRGLSVSPVTGCSAQSAAPCQTPGHAVVVQSIYIIKQ
uniref:Family with sequence similarity 117 member Aa n=1 Tax=Cyprinus carpio TaxID=7962 RepID=A0A8C1NCG4_CYPCA